LRQSPRVLLAISFSHRSNYRDGAAEADAVALLRSSQRRRLPRITDCTEDKDRQCPARAARNLRHLQHSLDPPRSRLESGRSRSDLGVAHRRINRETRFALYLPLSLSLSLSPVSFSLPRRLVSRASQRTLDFEGRTGGNQKNQPAGWPTLVLLRERGVTCRRVKAIPCHRQIGMPKVTALDLSSVQFEIYLGGMRAFSAEARALPAWYRRDRRPVERKLPLARSRNRNRTSAESFTIPRISSRMLPSRVSHRRDAAKRRGFTRRGLNIRDARAPRMLVNTHTHARARVPSRGRGEGRGGEKRGGTSESGCLPRAVLLGLAPP